MQCSLIVKKAILTYRLIGWALKPLGSELSSFQWLKMRNKKCIVFWEDCVGVNFSLMFLSNTAPLFAIFQPRICDTSKKRISNAFSGYPIAWIRKGRKSPVRGSLEACRSSYPFKYKWNHLFISTFYKSFTGKSRRSLSLLALILMHWK